MMSHSTVVLVRELLLLHCSTVPGNDRRGGGAAAWYRAGDDDSIGADRSVRLSSMARYDGQRCGSRSEGEGGG